MPYHIHSQASKKGIVEAADAILVNKADGDLLPTARNTKADYAGTTFPPAIIFNMTMNHILGSNSLVYISLMWLNTGGLRFVRRKHPDWAPPVLLMSARSGLGIEEVLNTIKTYR